MRSAFSVFSVCRWCFFPAALFVAVAALLTTRASAVDYTWKDPVSGNWSDSTKWVDGIVPISITAQV